MIRALICRWLGHKWRRLRKGELTPAGNYLNGTHTDMITVGQAGLHELARIRICDRCADDEPVAYDSDRGYTAPGGVGCQFMRQVAEAHDAIVPRAVVELDASVTIAPATEQMPDSVPLRFRRDLGRWEK